MATEAANPGYAAWELRLGRIAEAAGAWQRSMGGEPADIEDGSDLAGDGEQFATLSVSNLVGYSLAAATEHLDFTTTVMIQTGTMYPTAYLTVLRTALLAASHAAWILIPEERAIRQLRALELLADDLRSEVAMVTAAFSSTDAARGAKAKMLDQLAARQKELQPVADVLKPGLDVTKCRINNTAIIELVAQSTHDEDLAIGGVNMVWRTGSAAAHGQRSFATMRLRENDISQSASGARFSLLRGDLVNDIGPAAASASLALSLAFKLHDQRRKRHVA